MSRRVVRILAALVLLCSGSASAQDLSGDWQGALAPALRVILHVEKSDGATWKATLASIDQSPDWGAGIPVDAITLQGSTLAFSIAAIRGTFSGTIAAGGNSIDGTWSQGQPLPLSLVRATRETAWKDPSPQLGAVRERRHGCDARGSRVGGAATSESANARAGAGARQHRTHL